MNLRQGFRLLTKGIFLISQAYWVFWLGMLIKHFFFGLRSDWLIPVLSDPEILYGFETIPNTLLWMGMVTVCTPCVGIVIYQAVYVLVSVGTRIWKRVRKERRNP